MKCPNPSCGSTKAYVGAFVVECPNQVCGHFSEKLRAEQKVEFWKDIDQKLAATMPAAPRQAVVVSPPIAIPSRPVTIPDLSEAQRKYAATKGIVMD